MNVDSVNSLTNSIETFKLSSNNSQSQTGTFASEASTSGEQTSEDKLDTKIDTKKQDTNNETDDNSGTGTSSDQKVDNPLKFHGRRLEYSIHDTTKEIMVKVIDKEDGSVIREVPPEKLLDMMGYLWEKTGILVDEKR